MSNFVYMKELDPVNLDKVAVITHAGKDVLFWNDNDKIIYGWKFKTEESAFRAYQLLQNEKAEELS